MIRVPTRLLPWLAGLLALAAIPVCVAALRTERWDDCADPERLRDVGSLVPGDAEGPRKLYRTGVFQRVEGTLPAGPGLHPLRFRIVRTDEPRDPFEQPTRFLRVPMDPERSNVRHVEADGTQLPVHFAYAHLADTLRIVASVYLYDGQAVESLLRVQIGSAWSQLLHGRRPLTLLQVEGFGAPELRERIERGAIDWLVAGARAYREVCGH